MPTIGSITKTIRFSPTDLGIIEDLMRKENTTFNNAVHLLVENGVHPKKIEKSASGTPENEKKQENTGTPLPKTDISDIEEMASLMRVPTETLLSDFRKLLEDGELYYSGNKLVNPHYEEFEQLCELKKQPIDKVIGNVIRQMGG